MIWERVEAEGVVHANPKELYHWPVGSAGIGAVVIGGEHLPYCLGVFFGNGEEIPIVGNKLVVQIDAVWQKRDKCENEENEPLWQLLYHSVGMVSMFAV